MKKYQRFAFLSAMILFSFYLTGCSVTQLAYEHADWLIIHRVDHYFDITSEQRTYLKNRLAEHLVWHRQEELPLYVEFLKAFRDKSQNGLMEQELDWAFDDFDARRRALFNQILPDAVYFLASLSKAQITYYEKKVVKNAPNNNAEKSAAEIQQRLEKRADKIITNMEDWFGPLSDAQIHRIKILSFTLPDIKEDWANYRDERRKELIQLLRQKNCSTQVEAYLKSVLLNPTEDYPPQYRDKFAQMQKAIKTMILQIDKLLTSEQRTKALKKIDNYVRDFEKLKRY